MSIETDTRDRVIRLEAEVEALTRTVASMDVKLTEVHGVLQRARGSLWTLTAAAAVGGFISAKLAPLLPWFSK